MLCPVRNRPQAQGRAHSGNLWRLKTSSTSLVLSYLKKCCQYPGSMGPKKPRVRVLPSDLLSHCSVIKRNQLNYSFNSKGKIRIGVSSYTFVTIAIRESFPTRCKTQWKVMEMTENNLITFQWDHTYCEKVPHRQKLRLPAQLPPSKFNFLAPPIL